MQHQEKKLKLQRPEEILSRNIQKKTKVATSSRKI